MVSLPAAAPSPVALPPETLEEPACESPPQSDKTLVLPVSTNNSRWESRVSRSQCHPDMLDVMTLVEPRTHHDTRSQDLLKHVPDSIRLSLLFIKSAVPTPLAQRKVRPAAWHKPKMSHTLTPSRSRVNVFWKLYCRVRARWNRSLASAQSRRPTERCAQWDSIKLKRMRWYLNMQDNGTATARIWLLCFQDHFLESLPQPVPRSRLSGRTWLSKCAPTGDSNSKGTRRPL